MVVPLHTGGAPLVAILPAEIWPSYAPGYTTHRSWMYRLVSTAAGVGGVYGEEA